jgi:hypothetical protein
LDPEQIQIHNYGIRRSVFKLDKIGRAIPFFQEITLQLEVNGVKIAEKLASRAPWDIQTMDDEPVTSSE